MFIAETWADEDRLNRIKHSLQFDHLFLIPWMQRGGGLVLFWKEVLHMTMETSKNHIDCIISMGTESAWRFTGFYGEPNTHKRVES